MKDPFLLDDAGYVRQPYSVLLNEYLDQSSQFLHRMTGRDLSECRAYVERVTAPQGEHPITPPQALVLVRDEHGDRKPAGMSFDAFLQTVEENNERLSPSGVAYWPPEKRKSILAMYILDNLAIRSKAKKEMMAAKMRKDLVLAARKNSEQTTQKIKNNALSGGQSSTGTALWNKSAHTALTSMCRTATGYGNSNNERFLYGNRHYATPEVLEANIICLMTHTDYARLEAVIQQFGLVCPTVDQAMQVVHRGTEAYWRSASYLMRARHLLETATPLERAAFCYTGDLYHLAQFNPEVVRTMLERLSTRADSLPHERWAEGEAIREEGMVILATMLCAKDFHGGTLRDADGNGNPLKDVNPVGYGHYLGTLINIQQVVQDYAPLIHTLWATRNVPASVYRFPTSLRYSVITSDTDSSIFTVQHWTQWMVGRSDFSEKANAVGATMVYLTTQTIRHLMALAAASWGVTGPDKYLLQMKNEFYFPVYVPTSRAKHYYAGIAAQEGNVFEKLDYEVKGAAYRNANLPPLVRKGSRKLMEFIVNRVIRDQSLCMRDILHAVAAVEKTLMDGMAQGERKLFSRMQLKPAESYQLAPEKSNYRHHLLWQDVFADKYGHVADPPYVSIKVSVMTDTPSKVRDWLESLDDPAIRDRMIAFMNRCGMDKISTFYLPESVVTNGGIPKEIIAAAGIRDAVATMMDSFYLTLESLGWYVMNSGHTKMISDDPQFLVDPWPGETIDLT